MKYSAQCKEIMHKLSDELSNFLYYFFYTIKVQIKCIVLASHSGYSREHTSVQTEPAVVHYNRRDSVMETALIIKH